MRKNVLLRIGSLLGITSSVSNSGQSACAQFDPFGAASRIRTIKGLWAGLIIRQQDRMTICAPPRKPGNDSLGMLRKQTDKQLLLLFIQAACRQNVFLPLAGICIRRFLVNCRHSLPFQGIDQPSAPPFAFIGSLCKAAPFRVFIDQRAASEHHQGRRWGACIASLLLQEYGTVVQVYKRCSFRFLQCGRKFSSDTTTARRERAFFFPVISVYLAFLFAA